MMALSGKHVTTDDTKMQMSEVFVERMEPRPTKKIFGAGISCVVVEIPRTQCGMQLATGKHSKMTPWSWAIW